MSTDGERSIQSQQSQQGERRSEPKERVAVVAVHGVADQRPGDSARQIADLIRLAAPEAYSTFRETRLRIPAPEILAIELPPRCAGLELRPEVEHSPQADYDQRLREQGPRFAELALGHRSTGKPTTGRQRVYDTLRLEAMRSVDLGGGARASAPDTPPPIEVHVHELYWADLSRLGSRAGRVASELWSLLIHVLWLGREALRTAREVERQEDAGWAFRVLDTAHRFAHRTFTLALLPFNLMLAILLALLLATAVPALPASWLFAAMAAGAGAVLGGEALRRPAEGLWLPGSAAGLLVGAALGSAPAVRGSLELGRLLFLFGMVAICGGLLRSMATAYERRRPGGRRALLLAAALPILYSVGLAVGGLDEITGIDFRTGLAGNEARWLFWAAEPVIGGLGLSWLVFCAAGLVAGLAQMLLPRDTHGARLRRAATTARITMLAPATLLFVLGFTVWSFTAPPIARLADVAVEPLWLDAWTGSPETSTLAAWIVHLIARSATTFMAALVAVLLVVLVLLSLPILPAVLADAHPRRFRERWSPPSLGRGLDRGFGLARVAGEVLFVALTLGTTLGLLAPSWPDRFPAFLSDSGGAVGSTWVRTWMSWLGGTAAVSFATVLALSGRVSVVSQRISPVLDVLLDVDNHLRVEPSGFEGRNARAEIVARAVALLGELRRGGYQRIVFVAHSQGTALVADLFRQLRFRGERVATDVGAEHLRELGPRLQFLTMGSPLRQLYHLRFPHLYGWVQGATAADLGIRRWRNFYRAGDYIGRDLWLAPTDASRFSVAPELPSDDSTPGAKRQEPSGDSNHPGAKRPEPSGDSSHHAPDRCIGSGGHIRYWDETAPEIARAIDDAVTQS